MANSRVITMYVSDDTRALADKFGQSDFGNFMLHGIRFLIELFYENRNNLDLKCFSNRRKALIDFSKNGIDTNFVEVQEDLTDDQVRDRLDTLVKLFTNYDSIQSRFSRSTIERATNIWSRARKFVDDQDHSKEE